MQNSTNPAITPDLTAPSGAAVLSVNGLHVRYGNVQAVKNISFEVRAGEIFGLLGPNGAGKTSSLSAVEGLLTPHSGSIRVAGFDIREKPLHARASMGVQLQATSFQPELTVLEILALYAGIYGLSLNKSTSFRSCIPCGILFN